MQQTSLKKKIFRLVVGVVSITSLLILMVALRSIAEHAQQQQSQDLNTAKMVLTRVIDDRKELLLTSANVLTDDWPFKSAVARDDVATLKSVLGNHGRRIGADLISILSLQGEPIVTVPDPSAYEDKNELDLRELAQQTLQSGTTSGIVSSHGKLFQLLFVTVDAPSPVAIAVLGFEVNQALIKNLEAISQLDIRVKVESKDSAPFSVASKEIPSTATVVNVSQGDSIEWLSFLLWDRNKLIESDFSFVQRDDLDVRIVLSTTVERLFSSFLSLIFNITLIAIFALVAAIALTAVISRQMTRPIEKLTQVATNIAKGDYHEEMVIDSRSQELTVLANSFKTMQINIREREQKIIHQAQHDDLTCLFNRNHIETKLSDKFAGKECFQAVGINIFGFRDINDTFGYHNGDLCLRELADRVSDLGGLAARLTGGELIWIPNTPVSESELTLIRDKLEKEIFVDGLSIPMRVSIGVIECPSDTHNAEDLFRRMNIVLDEAQNTDEKLLRFDPSFESSYLRRLSIITELKKALSTNQHELQLFYQPKMELSSDKILGVEALIRWQNDNLGFISPEDFIAIAEQAGFINKITEWVYQQAVKDVRIFREQGVDVVVAINISAQDVMNPEQLTMINSLLESNGLPAQALSFELTEGDLVKDPEQALQHLGYLRASGFSIAIDDFGTGYSSLAYLTQLPINVLKIDKSFVLNLDTSKDDQTIVKTVIKLAHSFGMEVVAEGVENEASLALLKEWGCEWAQGYFICRPIAAPDLIQWYKERNNSLAS